MEFPSRKTALNMLVLTSVVVAVFGSTIRFGFVWDDNVFMVGRSVYRDFDLGRIFFSAGNGVEYLPLRDFTYALDYALWGERAGGFHLSNLLLYVGNVLVVYFLTLRLLPALKAVSEDTAAISRAALLSSLLFALHPLHSEAVSFVTCRNVVLSGLLFFGALLLYLRAFDGERLHVASYSGALACFGGALLSKATVVILPLLLLLPPFLGPRLERRRRMMLSLPFFFLAGIFFYLFREIGIRSGIIGNAPEVFSSSSWADKVATAVQIPWFYLAKFLLPVRLSANYDVRFDMSWTSPAPWGCLVALTILVGLLFRYSRRSVFPLFALGWFLATLLPVLNFFATIPVVADRYAYLPIFSLCLTVAVIASIPRSGKVRWIALALSAFIAIAWGGMTARRNGVWRTDRILWEETVRVSPDQMKNRVNLATVYYRDREFEKALALLEKTKEGNYSYDFYNLFKGHKALDSGDLTGAVTAFRRVVSKDDDFIDALYILAETYEKLQEHDKAVEYYNKTLLSTGFDANQNRESARKALQRLLRVMNPDIDVMRTQVRENPKDLIARMLLAEKLTEFGQYDEALIYFLEMEKLGMTSWKLYTSIANTYMKQRMYQEAATYFERGLAMNPSDGYSLNSLGILYKKMKKYPEAIALFQRAMSDDREGFAAFNLALAYYQQGDREKSIRSFGYVRDRFPQLREKVAPFLDELSGGSGGGG